MKSKNKVVVIINGDELSNFMMGACGKIPCRVHETIVDSFDWKDYEEIRSLFLSNPDYFKIKDYRKKQ